MNARSLTIRIIKWLLPMVCYFAACSHHTRSPAPILTPLDRAKLHVISFLRDSGATDIVQEDLALRAVPHAGDQLALALIGDTLIYLFRNRAGIWAQESDSIPWCFTGPDVFHFRCHDINGDGRVDILPSTKHDVHGNFAYTAYLADANDRFHARPDVWVSNLFYDTLTHKVTGWEMGGVFYPLTEYIYEWRGDSLVNLVTMYENIDEFGHDSLRFVRQAGEGHEELLKTVPTGQGVADTVLFDEDTHDYGQQP